MNPIDSHGVGGSDVDLRTIVLSAHEAACLARGELRILLRPMDPQPVTEPEAMAIFGMLRTSPYGPVDAWFHAGAIALQVTALAARRLNDLTTEDCLAYGCPGGHGAIRGYSYSATPREHLAHIWGTTNHAGAAALDPFVWIIGIRAGSDLTRDQSACVVTLAGDLA